MSGTAYPWVPSVRPVLARTMRGALLVAGGGLLWWLVGLLFAPERALFAWLFAFVAVLTIALGALLLTMIGHVSHARTLASVRGLTTAIASPVPLFVLLFLPIVLGAATLYPWAPPLTGFTDQELERLHAKQGYLNLPFFAIRALFYFVVWSGLLEVLRRGSAAARGELAPLPHGWLGGWSGAGIILVSFTGTFAAIDWVMSLSPLWFSSIYGAYLLMGGMAGAWGLVLVLDWLARARGGLAEAVDAGQRRLRGNLLLTFVMLWIYFGFSQYLIIWIADLPAEVPWYVTRTRDGWGIVAAVLLAGHFVLPLLLLLFRRIKQHPGALAAIGGWVLLMHLLDTWWVVLPELSRRGVALPWLALPALLAVGGAAVAAACWLIRSRVPADQPPPLRPATAPEAG